VFTSSRRYCVVFFFAILFYFYGANVNVNVNVTIAGFPRFIQLTELFTGGYIKEESLYLKVYVDISSVVKGSIDWNDVGYTQNDFEDI